MQSATHRSHRLLLVTCLTLVTGMACGGAEQPGAAPIGTSDEALAGGCHWDCPKCPANRLCALAPCVLICPRRGQKCGTTFCPSGQVCCNESCGICTESGGVCTQQVCTATGCASDADCLVYSNYCDGCTCEALLTTDPIPVCTTTIVRCIADPCMGHTAACDPVTHTCVVK